MLEGKFWWQVAWVLGDLDMTTKKIFIRRLAFQSRATKGEKERKKEEQSKLSKTTRVSLVSLFVAPLDEVPL